MVAAFSFVMSSLLLIPAVNMSFAQYQGEVGSATLEEQLELAKEKTGLATQQGAYGSGTAMFGTNLDNSVLMIIAIGVILGGVAAAFFAAASAAGRKRTVEATSGGSYSSSGKFCTNCGVQLGDNQKFCGNCGTKA